MLNIENSLLLIIDIQEKLVNMLGEKNGQKMKRQAEIISKTADILKIPTMVTEQYPKGLGHTVAEIVDSVDTEIFEKTAFSALGEDSFKKELIAKKKKQIVICGIEAHVCVYQTASDLLDNGFEVFVLKDASMSRDTAQKDCAMELLKQKGAKLTTVEMALFQWLKSSDHPDFKTVQGLIK